MHLYHLLTNEEAICSLEKVQPTDLNFDWFINVNHETIILTQILIKSDQTIFVAYSPLQSV